MILKQWNYSVPTETGISKRKKTKTNIKQKRIMPKDRCLYWVMWFIRLNLFVKIQLRKMKNSYFILDRHFQCSKNTIKSVHVISLNFFFCYKHTYCVYVCWMGQIPIYANYYYNINIYVWLDESPNPDVFCLLHTHTLRKMSITNKLYFNDLICFYLYSSIESR